MALTYLFRLGMLPVSQLLSHPRLPNLTTRETLVGKGQSKNQKDSDAIWDQACVLRVHPSAILIPALATKNLIHKLGGQ